LDTEFQLAEFLPYRLSRLAEQVSASLAGVYASRYRLSVPQWRILATLSESPGLSATTITRRCNLDKVKVSRAVADLEGRGLLRRRPNATDGRASELHLTAKGRRLFSRLAPLALDWQNDLLAGLSAPECDSLQHLLGQLEDRAAALSERSAAPQADCE